MNFRLFCCSEKTDLRMYQCRQSGYLSNSLPVCWLELGFADQFYLEGRYFCLWFKILLFLLSIYSESSHLELLCRIFQLSFPPRSSHQEKHKWWTLVAECVVTKINNHRMLQILKQFLKSVRTLGGIHIRVMVKTGTHTTRPQLVIKAPCPVLVSFFTHASWENP